MKIHWLFCFLPGCHGFIRQTPRTRSIREKTKRSGVFDQLSATKWRKADQVYETFSSKQTYLSAKFQGEPHNIITKGQALLKISRIDKNFLPVSLLCVVSGLSTRPHAWSEWIHSPPFLAASFMLHLMTSASMILNDIQDYDVDCINNPSRPLITGAFTIQEATIVTVSMFSLYTYLGIQYLPPILDPIWSLALGLVTIYTPVLKRICFVKNLTCATVIALSVPFVGFSVINPLESTLPDFHWLILTTRIVFTTSLFIEMMLDITDMVGDRAANIPTLPVVLGEPITLSILTGILSSSLWVSITEARNEMETGIILLTYVPLYFYIIQINHHKYTKKVIIDTVKQTTIQLGLYLFMMTLNRG